eukprot:TRINITY_DN33245_c0_g1_i1.p2 TRINITY_DN33245_c0_g1~~TRINITY_DN33245_c0_g1_i1.p2  ORF type:complete len:137 (-),score=17.96 TRINITY_DN33245_c0_g1_i1:226-636(-)
MTLTLTSSHQNGKLANFCSLCASPVAIVALPIASIIDLPMVHAPPSDQEVNSCRCDRKLRDPGAFLFQALARHRLLSGPCEAWTDGEGKLHLNLLWTNCRKDREWWCSEEHEAPVQERTRALALFGGSVDRDKEIS